MFAAGCGGLGGGGRRGRGGLDLDLGHVVVDVESDALLLLLRRCRLDPDVLVVGTVDPQVLPEDGAVRGDAERCGILLQLQAGEPPRGMTSLAESDQHMALDLLEQEGSHPLDVSWPVARSVSHVSTSHGQEVNTDIKLQ